MAGSTGEKRLGVWELRVFVGLYGAGKPKQQSRTFEGNKRAAERELARLVSKADARKDESVEVPTEWSRDINQAIEGWKRNGWEDLSPNTTNRYEGIWRKHIRNTIGARKIASLTLYEVETYFRGLKRSGLGEKSVKQARAVLHRSCRLVRKWSNGVLPNLIADTDLTTISTGMTSLPFLAISFAAAASMPRLGPMILLPIGRGSQS